MLLELSITDFAIIERTTIRFSEGLNALTGETGSGKSILLDALGAVLGSRVSSDLVRTGARIARVEAAFEIEDEQMGRLQGPLDEIGIVLDDDTTIILSREIQANGRSSARINGRLTTAQVLAHIGSLLVDIHGQSDHLAILRATEQRGLLDRYGGLDAQRSQLAHDVREWRSIRNRIAELSRNARDQEQRIDLLRFQIDEITKAELGADEDRLLSTERDILRNADRLRVDALEALSVLVDDGDEETPSVSGQLRLAISRTIDIAALDASATELSERANELLVLTEDLTRDLRHYAEGIESNDERLSLVEDRLATIQTLKRKYGSSIDEIHAFVADAERSLHELSSGENDESHLRDRETILAQQIATLAMAVSEQRAKAARELGSAIEQSIGDLRMGQSQISIAVSQRDDESGIEITSNAGTRIVHIDESGIDDVEFLIAPNAGEALKPLAKIASGGETARLMLATKSILSEVDLTPTLVFDEIDVGVGGRSGQVVGEKLWDIARNHQVIVVTHLPQIAAFAETHLRIEKTTHEGRTVSEVRWLNQDERQLEIAAMIDGLPPGEAARLNAKTMLERSQAFIAATQ